MADDRRGTTKSKTKRLPNAAPEPSEDFSLSILNRHWYRRCLDKLNDKLMTFPANPTLEEKRRLCDEIISNFLLAVTGQAPDSSEVQFPAERAYYFPLKDDQAGRFNFAKAYFQVNKIPETVAEAIGAAEYDVLKDSLWSYFPWGFGEACRFSINPHTSINEDQDTISFEEMVSIRARFRQQLQTNADFTHQNTVILSKSLILPAKHDKVSKLFQQRGGKGLQNDKRWKKLTQELDGAIKEALTAIFEIYRSTPGNSMAESILGNQVMLIMWLNNKILEQGRQIGYDALIRKFIGHFFFGGKEKDSDIEEIHTELTSEKDITTIAKSLIQKTNAVKGSAFSEYNADQKVQLAPYLQNFIAEFFDQAASQRLERDLSDALGDRFLKSGSTEDSYVWVSADFEEFNHNLDPSYKLWQESADREFVSKFEAVGPEQRKLIESRSITMAQPFVLFFSFLDEYILSVRKYGDQSPTEILKSYWRTSGKPKNQSKIFASYKDTSDQAPHKLQARKLRSLKNQEKYKQSGAKYARPQNIFLRVKVCDSLKLPLLNGFFVFTTDFDECAVQKVKSREERSQDLQDLLAFAKVYFFIVRDFFRAMDRAQEAREIGQLNQALYDRRLSELVKKMQKRSEFKDEERVLDKGFKYLFLYDTLNFYARSTLMKPEVIRGETFPYDRLFIMPFFRALDREEPYKLPFFLFQSIFIEKQDGKVAGGHYSLIKPFQSTLDEKGKATVDLFKVKSFQEVTQEDGVQKDLQAFLVKNFLGEHDFADKQLQSDVVKGFDGGEDGEQSSRIEPGLKWATEAILSFDKLAEKDRQGSLETWLRFLEELTSEYQDRLKAQNSAREPTDEDIWFLFRFGMLRMMLEPLSRGKDTKEDGIMWGLLQERYRERLKLKYNADKQLDILRLVERSYERGFEVFKDFFSVGEDNVGRSIQFMPKKINGKHLLVDFFEHLTQRVTNGHAGDSQENMLTFFQPLLTRPVKRASGERERILEASSWLGECIPDYSAIREGEHALSMFLGLAHVNFGEKQNREYYPCLIAMIRDFDDTKTQGNVTPEEVDEQLNVDLGDLGLFTSTYFQNINKYIADEVKREEITVLTKDVTQIARNWYSSGMDFVSKSLREDLAYLLETQTENLNRLHVNAIDGFFDSILQVLLRDEYNRDNKLIKLESFPFDRMLHIPLNLNLIEGTKLCYARTSIVNKATGDETGQANFDFDTASGRNIYEWIRRNGRIWDASGGAKTVARNKTSGKEARYHIGLDDSAQKDLLEQMLFKGQTEGLRGLIQVFSQFSNPGRLETFLRRLFKSNALQTLALAGLLAHLVQMFQVIRPKMGQEEWKRLDIKTDQDRKQVIKAMDGLLEKLKQVIAQNITSLDAQRDNSDEFVLTDVHMDKALVLQEGNDDAGFTDDTRLPVFKDFFKLFEPDGYIYGLEDKKGKRSESRAFYIYYAIKAPDTFLEKMDFSRYYKGIFCFVVDDTDTAAKGDDAETADQQDIQTFIHNAVRYLKQTLDDQALYDRIHKPGIEEVIVGTLHRIKNDINIPLSVLKHLEDNWHTIQNADQDDLPDKTKEREQNLKDIRKKVANAKDALEGFGIQYKKLKDLSDIGQDTTPLRTFDSNWLGWNFVEKLCSAIKKPIDEAIIGNAGGEKKEIDRLARAVEKQKKLALAMKEETSQDLMLDRIQRSLNKIVNLIEAFAGHQGLEPTPVPLISYSVHSPIPLKFLGSFLLDEAMEVLVENAFHAFWEYACEKDNSGTKERTAIFKMLCRKNDDNPDEILIDLANSCRPIHPDILTTLQSETPKSLDRKQHARKSGKKGGSGFGFYFARRIVRDFCGGSQWQKNTDIRFNYLHEQKMANSTINLVNFLGRGSQRVSSDLIFSKINRFFKDVKTPQVPNTNIVLPNIFKVDHLIRAIHGFLESEQELAIKNTANALRHAFCEPIEKQSNRLRKKLRGELLDNANEKPAADLASFLHSLDWNNQADIPRGSIEKLRHCLHQFQENHPKHFAAVAKGIDFSPWCLDADQPFDEDLVLGLLGKRKGHEQQAKKTTEKNLDRILPLFNDEADNGLVFFAKFITTDGGGRPVPDVDKIRNEMKQPVIRVHCEHGNPFALAISLTFGSDYQPDLKPDPIPETPNKDYLHNGKYGSTLLNYARSLRNMEFEGRPVSGYIWFDKGQLHRALNMRLPTSKKTRERNEL